MVLIAFVICIVAATVVLWRRKRLARFKGMLATGVDVQILKERLSVILDRARAELPGQQLTALTAELREIRNAEDDMIQEGANPWEARRVGLSAAIQSVENHLSINDMLPE